MLDEKRLEILSNSAKYDVSCSSSGSRRTNTANGLGNTCFSGICHSFTQDGRCISLLKILMSNDCIFNCAYCTSRCSNNTPRATATPDEICEIVVSFYKRNYIEGLFLSSSIIVSPNYTMELLFDTVKKLRNVYKFNGYIHLKGIPGADKLLIERAGFFVDRISFNMELPSEQSLKLLAPQKSKKDIITPIKMLATDKYYDNELKRRKDFLPAGQTSQIIIGASPENDAHILKLTEYMYNTYKLKRMYYSSYVPTNFESSILPYQQTPLLREHRLYQADWLIRFYGFTADEITENDGNLNLNYDPKCAWALKHLDMFPIEINTATPNMLLRVPGIGIKSVYRILSARKYCKLNFDDLKRLRIVLKRAMHFITCNGKFLGTKKEYNIKELLINAEITTNAEQLSIFGSTYTNFSAITGEL